MNDIIEMLDALEGALSRLNAERVTMAAALREAERRLKTTTRGTRNAPKGRKPAAKTRRKPATAVVQVQQTAAPAAPAAVQAQSEPSARPAPKRQALGRGLSQLRRLPAAPEPAP
jgi:hypothetical protein